MTNGVVVEMEKKTEPKLVVGIVHNDLFGLFKVIWPVIQPGVAELAQESNGEYEEWQVHRAILDKRYEVLMVYMDRTGTAEPEKYQEYFAKHLETPLQDFVGFAILEPFVKDRAHIFQVYILPQYRNTNILKLGLEFIENYMKTLKRPSLSVCTRADASAALRGMGFKEQYTTYFKKL